MPHNKFVIFPTHRSRKRKQEEEEESDDEDIVKNEEDEYTLSDDEDLQSDVDLSDDEFMNDEGDNRVKPGFRERYYWYDLRFNNVDENPFQTVDGVNKLFYTSRWTQRPSLHWDVQAAVTRAERALESKQRKRTITLERAFSRSLRLTQVPYRELTAVLPSTISLHCVEISS